MARKRPKRIKKVVKKTEKKEKDNHFNKCIRCQKTFSSRKALIRHSKLHLAELREMQMLEEGHVPSLSKIGGEFKGKNKIVVA